MYNDRRLPSSMPYLPLVPVIALLVQGLGIGTGGASTFEYLKDRGSKGYALAHYDPVSLPDKMSNVHTPVDDLAQIRNVLCPTVTDLANALGVSRQAIYDWQAGKPIAAENAARLANLAHAADLFLQEGLTATSQILRRPIFAGKNLFEIVRGGESADSAARMLIEIIRRERHQREVLRERLAGRPRISRESYEDLGTPMLDEKG